MKFANIIVDISHEKLDRAFQYIVPQSMEEEAAPGVRVQIPFGMGNRVISGFIIDITDTPEFPVEKMKEILSISHKETVIESKLIELAWWIKENYGSTMNRSLKTVLPVKRKMRAAEKKTVVLVSKEEALDKLPVFKKKNATARVRLLEELIESESIPYDLVVNKLNISTATLKALENMDIIRIEAETVFRNPLNVAEQKKYDIKLNDEQKNIVDAILTSDKKVHLIHGVTGSGKTEVYMELIAHTVDSGRQAIVLIPEIALTYQTVKRFHRRFGDKVSIINSRLSAGERYDQFERAKNGEVSIMIGPRSALFTPFKNIGLIIIDEEHEGSYKSESVPKYHARDVAIKRADMDNAKVVLGSATPSVDSYYRAQKGEYQLYKLNNRAEGNALANVSVVDLREELDKGNKSIFSRKLQKLIADRLEKRQQTMLFINRRGYAGFVSCRSCGNAIKCPHCDVTLKVHKNGKLICHYCGHEKIMPRTCPSCGSKYIAGFGTGTQKVEEMLKRRFPYARILRMDTDTTSKKGGHEKILSAFANHEADILVGTQMIVKGHDFPLVTLVGIIAADLSLYAEDYMAGERTFQLLTQAAGRAGRGKFDGEAVIQTYSPENYSIAAAAVQDYERFYEKEIAYRKLFKYPPAEHMAAFLLTSEDEKKLSAAALKITEFIRKNNKNNVIVIGPADASVSKINDIFRKVIYLKHSDNAKLIEMKKYVEELFDSVQEFVDISIQFDFTPLGSY